MATLADLRNGHGQDDIDAAEVKKCSCFKLFCVFIENDFTRVRHADPFLVCRTCPNAPVLPEKTKSVTDIDRRSIEGMLHCMAVCTVLYSTADALPSSGWWRQQSKHTMP